MHGFSALSRISIIVLALTGCGSAQTPKTRSCPTPTPAEPMLPASEATSVLVDGDTHCIFWTESEGDGDVVYFFLNPDGTTMRKEIHIDKVTHAKLLHMRASIVAQNPENAQVKTWIVCSQNGDRL